jgi:hypothetical protein
MATSSQRTRKRLPSPPPQNTMFNEWQLPSSTTAVMATPPEPRPEDMLFIQWQLPTRAAAETATSPKSSSRGLSGDIVDTQMTTPPKPLPLQGLLRDTLDTQMTTPTRGGTLLNPLSQDLFGDILDTEMMTPARTKTPLSPSSPQLVENTVGIEPAMSPRPSIETETPLSPSSQALPGDKFDTETTTSTKPPPRTGTPLSPLPQKAFQQMLFTKMMPTNHSKRAGTLSTLSGGAFEGILNAEMTTPTNHPIRAGTPLSPRSEELFGDILDAEPTQLTYPGSYYWSDTDGEDTDITKKPGVTFYDPAATPNLPSEDLFEDESQRTTDPSVSPTPSQSIKAGANASNSISLSTTLTLPHPHPMTLPNVGAPPIVRPQPVFCHLIYPSIGQASGADYGQGTIISIRQFKNQIFGDCVASPSENVFEALSQAYHFFEIRVELTIKEEVTATTGNEDKGKERANERHVELSRYFVPSALEENKYIEAHPKDVAAGLNPSRGRIGGIENLVPRVKYYCACVHPPNAFHALPRTVFLLKNHSFRASFLKRPPTALPAEWLLSGPGKEWGLTLDQAKVIWKAAAPKAVPKPETNDEEMY